MVASQGNRRVQEERGDGIIKFISEHWVAIYGMLMFGIGELIGYIRGKRK